MLSASVTFVDQTLAVGIICKKVQHSGQVAVNTLSAVFTLTGKGRFLLTDCVVRLRLGICFCGLTKIKNITAQIR